MKTKTQTYQNLWDAAKHPRGKFHSRKHLKKEERSQINNQTLYLKKLEKQQTKLKLLGERNNKDLNKNKIDNRNAVEKINKELFF